MFELSKKAFKLKVEKIETNPNDNRFCCWLRRGDSLGAHEPEPNHPLFEFFFEFHKKFRFYDLNVTRINEFHRSLSLNEMKSVTVWIKILKITSSSLCTFSCHEIEIPKDQRGDPSS